MLFKCRRRPARWKVGRVIEQRAALSWAAARLLDARSSGRPTAGQAAAAPPHLAYCLLAMARPQPFQYSQYILTKAQSMWHGAVILAVEKWKVWSWILCRRSLRATPWPGLHPYPWSTLICSSTLLVCLDYTIIPTKRNHCKSQKSFDYLIRNCSILTRTPLTKSGPYIRFSCKTNKHLWKYGIYHNYVVYQ